jgi:hypothetical protein
MAMFTDLNQKNRLIIAEFKELEFKQYFQVVEVEKGSWGDLHDYQYEIAVGPLGETRFCNLLKTRAIVAVDENDDGTPVVETWKIRFIFDSRK